MLPGCHSWDHSLPAEEVRLMTLVPWLYGKSWHGAGQPQETGQVNSLHFPCCARTPNSIPCFPQGFLLQQVAGGLPFSSLRDSSVPGSLQWSDSWHALYLHNHTGTALLLLQVPIGGEKREAPAVPPSPRGLVACVCTELATSTLFSP